MHGAQREGSSWGHATRGLAQLAPAGPGQQEVCPVHLLSPARLLLFLLAHRCTVCFIQLAMLPAFLPWDQSPTIGACPPPLPPLQLHYNSLYEAEAPPPPVPDDKLLGSRRLYSLLFGAPSPGPSPVKLMSRR